MERLIAELNRLFCLPGQTLDSAPPAAADGGAGLFINALGDGKRRVLSIAFPASNGWDRVAEFCRALQQELALPAPAISVDGQGYRVWISLASPIADSEAKAFLRALIQHLLGEPRGQGIVPDWSDPLVLPPSPLPDDERWAAFIDPNLGALFSDEPWLDMPPGFDRQAELLANFRSVSREEFEAARTIMAPAEAAVAPGAGPTSSAVAEPFVQIGAYDHPSDFLRAVMNHPEVALALRIEAAKALLASPENNAQSG